MDVNVRMAAVDDIDKLVKARFDYFEAENMEMTVERRLVIEGNLRQYLLSHIGADDFFAAVIENENQIISLAFLVIAERPANVYYPTGKVGTIYNVFTYPEYQKRGLATITMDVLIKEARRRNLSYVELSSSELGKPLYEKFGFKELGHSRYTEMQLSLID